MRNDIILIVGILLVATIGLVYLFFFRAKGNTVKVTVDGNTYGIYSLSQDRVEDIITGQDGTNYNRLIIKNGKAYVEKASCRDGICASHRSIFRDGESIVCLPNRVVITVVSNNTSNAPDAVA